ncbi:hypothetical protein Tco_0529614, partial [Tanacetum coccineum]
HGNDNDDEDGVGHRNGGDVDGACHWNGNGAGHGYGGDVDADTNMVSAIKIEKKAAEGKEDNEKAEKLDAAKNKEQAKKLAAERQATEKEKKKKLKRSC